MDFETIRGREQKVLAQTYGRYPVCLTRGENARCWDSEGKQYVDFTSGIGVNALGFCDEGWLRAVTEQLGKMQHTCNLFYNLPSIEAAELLTARTGMKRVFFANSGAEANEGAIKAARKYSFDKYGKGRAAIVSLQNSFHGRTVTTLAATGQDHFHQFFDPFTAGFSYAPANDLEGTLAFLTDDVCAVMVELIQGEGGVMPLDKAYVQAVAKVCAERDILLLVDEVQTGIGRTGTLLLSEQYGLSPDLVTVAKGLGGGLPIGAVLFGEKTQGVLGKGQHGTTFGGNPVVCAGACEILRRLDGAFLCEVAAKGAYLRKKILALPRVQSVAGVGMMLGIELEALQATDVISECTRRGLLVLSAKHKIRLLPPLTIPYEDIDAGLAILQEAIEAVQKGQ